MAAFFLMLANSKSAKQLICKGSNQIESIRNYETAIGKLRDSLELFTINEYLDNIHLSTPENAKIHLADIINSPTLVYRFNEYSCMPCVENDLEIIKQLADSIGISRVLIITRLRNSNALKIYLNNYRINVDSYNTSSELNLPIEMHALNESPFFLVLNNDLKVEFAYTSTPGHSINSVFFKRIIRYFKN
jgi:hypothetical protein